jgi:hypothetical protein
MDEEEFNKLFIDEVKALASVNESTSVKAVASAKEKKKKTVILVDMKRAQNGGIALARIKMPFPDVKDRISTMVDEGLSTEQLKSLEEFLPTPEEMESIKSYKGDVESLGQVEKYMLTMMDMVQAAPKRIRCMIYKQMFKSRVNEIKSKLLTLERACDDVKMSVRLRKVLR